MRRKSFNAMPYPNHFTILSLSSWEAAYGSDEDRRKGKININM
ncbi:hypothetical protein RINTHM_13820 [Richelia intracellularis HM01]|nr:hypothetical protein RINTHM_13820 [Richelia intracellularis HM01]